jgi:hypothetical protein
MSKLSDFIDALDLSVDQTHRGNCPICHGRNTFTATNDMGNVLYNCYKNSCGLSGAVRKNMDAHTIKALLSSSDVSLGSQSYFEQDLCRYSLPPYVVPYKSVDTPIDPTFLKRYDINPEDVYYDIKQDRVVFPVTSEQGVLVDAVGRTLTGRQPKWLRYASSPIPYVHGGSNDCAIIVEDAISAYVIGERYFNSCSGVALLGTQFTDFHKWYISKYFDRVIVALDPDARDKTLKIAKEIGGTALNLADDLKYMRSNDVQALEEMLYG